MHRTASGCVEHGYLSNSPMRLPRRVGERNLQPAEPLTVAAQGNHASPTRTVPASVSIPAAGTPVDASVSTRWLS